MPWPRRAMCAGMDKRNADAARRHADPA
jgi:hypothetical protein